MTQPLRLLVITEYYRPMPRNGSDVFCRSLIQHLKQRGHHVDIVARIARHHPKVNPEITVPVAHRLVNDMPALAEYLTQTIDVTQYDLIYNLGALVFGCNVVTLLALSNPNLPLVNHFQVLLAPLAQIDRRTPQEVALASAGQRAVCAMARLNIFISHNEHHAARMAGYDTGPNPPVVIPNGLPPTDFEDITPNHDVLAHQDTDQRPLILVTSGRFSCYSKGGDLIYRAFAQLAAQRSDLFLLSICDTDRFTELLAHVPAHRYTICKWRLRRDYLRLLAAADLVVLPARYEPFGLIALEAMFLGRCVVANNVGGLAESVHHQLTGLLNPLDAGVDGLVRAVSSLLQDPEQRATMGQAGRRIAHEDYSMTRITRLVENALHRTHLAGGRHA